VEMVVAAITYARLPEGGEGWRWERRNSMQFGLDQLAAPGLYLTFTVDEAAAHLCFQQAPRLVVTSLLLHVPSW